jgi:penicillin-binding protein 1A
VEPIFIQRVEDRDGRILWDIKPSRHAVISAESADIMTQLMVGVVERGTATRVKVLGRPIGGKTGTTNKTRDAWFIGFTPSLITGVWVGMDDERSLGSKETGSQAAAPIFITYMQEALKNQPVEQFPGVSPAVLAKYGSKDSEHDDEAASDDDESFYPEEETVPSTTTSTPSSTQQFFKDDLEG